MSKTEAMLRSPEAQRIDWREAAKRSAPLLAAVLIAVGLKAGLLYADAVPFNSDEAIVALMARHILQGERPIFFYGQAYMGSLDAWLIAGMFRLIGESVLAIRLVQIGLYGLYLVSVWWLARRWFPEERVATIAVWLVALPPVLISTYTTATLGGYSESILLGNVILGLGWEVTFGKHDKSLFAWLALGFVGGLAFWTLGLAAVYLLPVGLLGLMRFDRRLWKYYLVAALGFIVASSPWWFYNFTHENAAFHVLSQPEGEVSGIGKKVLGPEMRVLGLLLLGLPALIGLRPPWSPTFLPAFAAFVLIMVYVGVATYHLQGLRRGQPAMAPGSRRLLWLFSLGFVAIFVGTHFGTDATGRYFLPLFTPLVLATAAAFASAWRARPLLGAAGLLSLAALNLYGTALAVASPDKLTTQFDPITRFDNRHDQALMDFLTAHGVEQGYTNYWVSFRVAFLSQERILLAAELPYKSDLSYNRADDRYPAYSEIVAQAPQVVYVTTLHPKLDERLRAGLRHLGITFAEEQIGDYHVFYNLSQRVTPDELDLYRLEP